MNDRPRGSNGVETTGATGDPLADLRRANAELASARKAALNLMEDAILARDALRASEERHAFLLRLADALRPLADPKEVKAAAARVLGEHLRVNRAFYAEVQGDDWLVVRGYEQGVAPLADGPYSAEAFGPWIMRTYRKGGQIVFRDTQTDRRFAPAEREAHAATGILGAVGVPLVKEGRLVAILAVHTAAPRDWTDAEIGLVEETAERTWEAVERAKAEAALTAEKVYAESIVETLHEPLLVLNADLMVRSVNPAFYTHFRVTPADTIGRKVYDLGNGQWDIPALRTLLEDVLPDSNVFNDYEVTHAFEGLGRRVMLVNARRLDHVQLVLLGIRDVTERKRAEEALRASEARYRALVETQVEMVCQFRPDGTLLFVNTAYAREFGKTPAELIGTSFWPLIPPEGHAGVRARLDAMTPESPQVQIENMVTSADGPRWTMWTNRALRFDEAGRMTEAQSVGVDITERKVAEAAVKASEERLRAVAANLPQGAVFVVDRDLRYQLAAGEALGSAGYSSADVEGKTVAEVLPPALADRHAANFRRALAGESFRTEDAAHGRHYITHGVPLRDAAGGVTAALAVSYDITDRKLAEEGVRKVEERLRLALTAARMGIWTLDADTGTQVRDANLNALLGREAVETTQPFAEFFAHLHPADRATVEEAFARSIRDHQPLNVEFRVVRPDGAVRWLRDQGDVFHTAGGRLLAGACVDITELKEAEAGLQTAKELLEQRVTERTAELATAVDALETEMGRRRELARRLSTAQEDERRRIARDLHDSLGQYLAAMSLELTAAHRLAGEPDVRDRLARLTELAAETGREVHRLALELRPTALDDLGLAALQNYVEAWSARTGLPAEFGQRGLAGERFPWQTSTAVYRVVQEALTNVARHARATRVSVLVERQPDHLSVVVEDDGIGFDPDRMPTRPSTRGGLGLLGMRERMALVDGTIEIESATGSGTAVFVRVPLPAHEGGSHE